MSGSQWSFASILCQSRCRKGSLRWPLLWIGATGRKLNWFQRRENSMSNLTRWDAPEKFYMLTDKSGTFNFLPCPVWLNLPCSTRLILLRLFLPRSVFQPLIQDPFPFSEHLIQVSDKIQETLMRTGLYFVTLHRKSLCFLYFDPSFFIQIFCCSW